MFSTLTMIQKLRTRWPSSKKRCSKSLKPARNPKVLQLLPILREFCDIMKTDWYSNFSNFCVSVVFDNTCEHVMYTSCNFHCPQLSLLRWLGRVIHCTLPLYIFPLPNFHFTPTSIAELPFYTHFHCRTSILHPLPLPNYHSTPTSIAELPFYTHFHSTITPKFAHVPTSVASSPATHTVLGLLSVHMSLRWYSEEPHEIRGCFDAKPHLGTSLKSCMYVHTYNLSLCSLVPRHPRPGRCLAC